MNTAPAGHEVPKYTDDESKKRPPVVVTLVHGTILFARWRFWSRKPAGPGVLPGVNKVKEVETAKGMKEVAWYEEGSLFRKRLQKAIGIPCTVTEFKWSGANTEWDRLCAAGADSDFCDQPSSRSNSSVRKPTLREHIANYPNAAHVLIAHSHAGNICLAALNDQRTRAAVQALICLSTPFINVRERADSPVLMRFLHIAGWLLFSAALFGTIYLTQKWFPKPWDEILWTVGFMLVCVSCVLYAVSTEKRTKALRSWASAKRRAFNDPSVLALLSDGDEALLVLKMAEGLNSALRALWQLSVGVPLRIFAAQRRLGNNLRLSLPIIGAVFLLFLFWLLSVDVASPLKTNDWSFWIIVKFVGAALIASVFSILLWCFALAVPGVIMAIIGFMGLAFIRWLAFGWPVEIGFELTAETCPVGTAKITRLGPFGRARGLRHGQSYNDRRAPIHVARFIRETLGPDR